MLKMKSWGGTLKYFFFFVINGWEVVSLIFEGKLDMVVEG